MATKKSRTIKQLFHVVYSLGASIVILGALGKILHTSILGISGDTLLTIGLVVEAIVFAISALEPQEEDIDWSLVYPELAGDAPRKRNNLTDDQIETKLSEKLDKMLQEAQLDSNLMKRLGESIHKLSDAAKSMDFATDAAEHSKKYANELATASTHLENLNNLYQVQLESISRNAEVNTEASKYAEELKVNMAKLKDNLANLNQVYGGMLSAMKVEK